MTDHLKLINFVADYSDVLFLQAMNSLNAE